MPRRTYPRNGRPVHRRFALANNQQFLRELETNRERNVERTFSTGHSVLIQQDEGGYYSVIRPQSRKG